MKSPWQEIPENQKELETAGDIFLAFRCWETKQLYFRDAFEGGWVTHRPPGCKKCQNWDLLAYAKRIEFLQLNIPCDNYRKLLKSFE